MLDIIFHSLPLINFLLCFALETWTIHATSSRLSFSPASDWLQLKGELSKLGGKRREKWCYFSLLYSHSLSLPVLLHGGSASLCSCSFYWGSSHSHQILRIPFLEFLVEVMAFIFSGPGVLCHLLLFPSTFPYLSK